MSHKINSFEDLGKDFQLQLLNEIVTDHKFGKSIIDIIEPQFFPSESFQKIAHSVKKYHKEHEVLPNFKSLGTEIKGDVPVEHEALRAQLFDTLSEIELCKIGNLNVQKNAIRFCRLQSIRGAVNDIKTKLDRGIISDYDEIEKKIKDAITFKDGHDPILLFDNMEKVLSEDYRNPIPTGIKGIDDITKGGLSKGEVAMVIAPLGVGKTTFLTKVASSAFLAGKTVLQVFFEDKEESVQRKHFSALTGIPLSELHLNKEVITNKVTAIKQKYDNHLYLQKLPSDGVTIVKIKNVIKKINSTGVKVDVLVLDYIDCLSMEKESSSGEEWSNEGKIMRQFETMVDEMNVVGWTATQGNRSSTSVEVVKTENMGGNLKKAQIAHFIMSIGKTLEQKEQKVATISILKNRMGEDGMIFKDCVFDNGRIIIDTDDLLTEKGFESQKAAKNKEALRAHLNSQIRGNINDVDKDSLEIKEII
jgi:replicative DNA helicase